jgi:ubiquinone/menaquinone biosynthesis C-methylase UbiE
MAREITLTKRVAGFYNLMGRLIDAVYGENVHYGYWEDEADPATFTQAQGRLNDVVAGKLAISPSQTVLDLGCGTGGPARRIAATTGASILGVTVSKWQVAEANRVSEAAGLHGQARFEYADITDLPYPDASFHAAFALETLVHVADKPAALREALRVIRPGGRLVIADLTLRAEMTEHQRAVWSAMPVADAMPLREYVDLATGAGFEVTEALDCSRQVARSFEGVREAVRRPAEHLDQLYGAATMEQARQNMLEMLTVSEECIGYLILTARRP